MEAYIKEAIERYQCAGCTNGVDISCYQDGGIACAKHSAGTFMTGVGRIFLGLPTGFNRAGMHDQMKLMISKSFDECEWFYDKLNVPVWKYKNGLGHTIVRGLSPRINSTFLRVYLEDCIDRIHCIEITDSDIAGMD